MSVTLGCAFRQLKYGDQMMLIQSSIFKHDHAKLKLGGDPRKHGLLQLS